LQTAIDCLNTKVQFNSEEWSAIVKNQLSDYQIDWRDSWASVEACLAFERDNFLKNLLTVDDSHSMQFGLEVRVPFLDDEIIRASQTFHPSELFSYCNKTNSILGKAPLRKLLSETGFPEIASRQKLGFSAPTNLVADSLLEFLFNGENKGFYALDRPLLESLISTLGDRERQSLLWVLAEIKVLF
jgi:asparagine synthetase B (glutamine-hydrolysing)